MDPERIEFYDLNAFYEAIPEEGSLGILALGATGLLLWRRKRDECREQQSSHGK